MPAPHYLRAMVVGYVLSVAFETTVLLVLLSRRHRIRTRLLAGGWLTACTYPVVWLVLPRFFGTNQRTLYLLVAETWAPVAECILFWLAFVRGRTFDPPTGRWTTARDLAAIVLANLGSFGIGEVIGVLGGYQWLLGSG